MKAQLFLNPWFTLLILIITACNGGNKVTTDKEIAIAIALTQTAAVITQPPSPTETPIQLPPTTPPTIPTQVGTNITLATFTPTATQISVDLDLGVPSFQDTFDTASSYFYLGSDGQIQFEVKDGNLVMSTTGIVGDRWRIAELTSLSNFYLEVTARSGEKCAGKDSYGLIVRSPDTVNGYVFGVACDGSYRLYRMGSGQYHPIKEWAVNPIIHAGPNQTNILGIRTQGDSLILYINGQVVDEVKDSTYLQGNFGLMIRSDITPDFRVMIDKLSYWELPGSAVGVTTPVGGEYMPLPANEINGLENALTSKLNISFRGGKSPFYDPFTGQLLGTGNLLHYSSKGVYGAKQWENFLGVFLILKDLGWQEDTTYTASAPYSEMAGFRKAGNMLAFVNLSIDLANGATCSQGADITECYEKLELNELVYSLVINTGQR